MYHCHVKRVISLKLHVKKKKWKKKKKLYRKHHHICLYPFTLSLSEKLLKMKESANEKETINTNKTSNGVLPDIKKVSEVIQNMPNVRWAPLTGIPFERRVQTAAVLTWVFLLGNCFTIFFCSLFLPFLWPLHIAYIIYLCRDQSAENGGRRSDWFRRLPVWNYFAGYFPIKLVKEADLDPSKNYVFGYHPHGIISMGAFANFATEATSFAELFPGIKASLLTLTTNFKFPIYRDIILALGIASVSRHSCEHILSSGPGRSIVIVIGGASESLSARPGIADLVLKKRLGFIRMAIRHGADLVPTFSFGENDLYEQVDNSDGSWLWNIQKKMQQAVGFTLPLFHARGIFNCKFFC